jgi:hypothetical protein
VSRARDDDPAIVVNATHAACPWKLTAPLPFAPERGGTNGARGARTVAAADAFDFRLDDVSFLPPTGLPPPPPNSGGSGAVDGGGAARGGGTSDAQAATPGSASRVVPMWPAR